MSEAQTAAVSTAKGGSDLKVKMPIQVSIPRTEEKSGYVTAYTAYCIQVVDFGRPYTVEKRFDDFNKLYADLTGLVDDGSLPALPEKKMFSSTNAEVVAERKPQLEKLLKYALRREEIVFDTGHCIAKFLEIPVGAMVCLRYLMSKGKKHSYTRQCWKLLEKQFLKEHAWRICHESVVRMNLHLMSTEGAFTVSSTTAVTEVASPKEIQPSGDGAPEAEAALPPAKLTEADIEMSVIDMVKHSITEGDEEARKCFAEENGIAVVLGMMLRLVKKAGEAAGPDKRLKEVLTALIRAEGEHFPAVFAAFLSSGGIAHLAAFAPLCAAQASFAEFMGKALWLAWELDTQKAFLQASSADGDALAVLGALFSSGSKSGQLLAGLLLSTLISNGLFSHDQAVEAKAAAGVAGLVEDLAVSMPVGLAAAQAKSPGSSGAEDDSKAAEALIASTSRSEKSFCRIVDVACAPNESGVQLSEDHPLWSACSFSLWFLAKAQSRPEVQGKADRLAKLRAWLPAVASSGPHWARWLAAHLLLQLHLPLKSAGGAAQFSGEEGIGAERTFHEQTVVEVGLSEQVGHAVAQLQAKLQQNRTVIAQQKALVDERQQPLVGGSTGTWSADVSKALERLLALRQQLSSAAAGLEERERHSRESLANFTDALEVDSTSTPAEAERTLRNVQDLESVYLTKKADLKRCEEELQVQMSIVEQCNAEVDEADKAVASMRKRVSDMEQEASSKQRDAQYQRTLASSDLTAIRGQLTDESEQLDKKMAAIKEKAQKLQSSDPQGPEAAKETEAYGKLKQEMQQCKQRRNEVQAELQRLQVDPATVTQTAARLDAEASDLLDQLGSLRSQELMQLEHSHSQRRDTWQRETTRLQDARFRRDAAERETSDLRRQLDDRWRLWSPVWTARLNHWSTRASALSAAQAYGKQLDEALQKNWDLFQEEQAARGEVLNIVAQAQQRLSELAEQMAGIGDLQ